MYRVHDLERDGFYFATTRPIRVYVDFVWVFPNRFLLYGFFQIDFYRNKLKS
jgi:hypothetical protein